MDKIQECAKNFKTLAETTSYTFHVSLNKRISVFDVDFQKGDFHHAVGLQYLHDVAIPRNTGKVIEWILNKDKPITDEYLAKDSNYKGCPGQERDVELRISEFRFLEEYLDADNWVYLYSPKDAPYKNSIIQCDYIIKSHSEKRNQSVFIFLARRRGVGTPCRIISFGVKKSVEYGGIYQYVMLKDKSVNGVRNNILKHPRYTGSQILQAEPNAEALYIDELINAEKNK